MTASIVLRYRNFRFIVLTFVLFWSGFASMICQLTWIKQLQQLFGTYVIPVAMVPAVFLLGLAFGSFIFGKLADGWRSPGLLLTAIFFAIVGYVALFFHFFPYLREQYYLFTINLAQKTALLQLFRFLFTFLVLIVPTILMGAFIPLVAKIIIDTPTATRKRMAVVFGINSIGAAAGILVAGFFLLGRYGLHAGYIVPVFVYGISGLLLIAMLPLLHGVRLENKNSDRDSTLKMDKPVWPMALVFAVLFIDGFCMMGYEVAWTRLLVNFSYEKTIYFVTAIIASIILGSGTGSFALSIGKWNAGLLRRYFAWMPVASSVFTLTALLVFFVHSPEWISMRVNYTSWNDILVNEYVPVLVLLTFPAVPMGMILPAAARLITRNLDHVGKRIGAIGWINTLGSIAGSLLAALFLIPLFGVIHSFVLLLLLNLFAGILLLYFHKWKVVLTGFLFSFLLMLLIPFRNLLPLLIQSYYPDDKLIAYIEGPVATVTVQKIPSGVYALSVNGDKTAFTSIEDLRVHRTLAAIPAAYCPDYRNALVVGFGLGVTTGILAEKEDATVTVVDLSPEVFAMADYFKDVNNDVLSFRNVHTVADDGRSFLSHSAETYNLITSNAVHPRLSSGLYTEEFYSLCRKKLTPEGVFCQWIPTNWLTDTEFRSLIRAFINVFNHGSLWFITRSHTVLLATPTPVDLTEDRFKKIFSVREMEEALQDADLPDPSSLASLLLINDAGLRNLVIGAPTNTDNLPLIESSKEVTMKPNPEILECILENIAPLSSLVPDSREFTETDSLWIKRVQFCREQLLQHVSFYRNTFRQIAK